LLPRPAILLIFFTSLTVLVFAEGTRTWEQSKYDDFAKGTTHGVAISSIGTLQLAPSFKLVASTPSSAVWAAALGPHGEIYAATGAPARVYRIVPGGQPVPVFQPQELQVQSLVVDKNGALYAATNPDGKVYKIEHVAGAAAGVPPATGGDARHSTNARSDTPTPTDWESSTYFDPATKYIWALALDTSGNLYVATGDHGQIFRVAPDGNHSLFFQSDEPHIRTLAFDSHGNLIAGSDGSGLVYRINSNGEGFVLYAAPKREITSIAIDNSGNIYAAAAGEKRTGGGSPNATIAIPAPSPPSPSGPSGAGASSASGPGSEPTVLNSSGGAVAGGSEIYRLSPDGSPSRIWNSRDDLVYSLAFNEKGRLLAGTGNHGEIFEISSRDAYSELVKAAANQVTAFTRSSNGDVYASTSNLGKVFLLTAAPDAEGSYESDVFDAHVFSKWGRAEFRGKGNVELFARSGNVDNPDRNWSTWKKIDLQKDAEIAAPPARFVQWKAILHPGEPAPQVESVTLNYLPKNVAPEFDDVNVTPGTRYQSAPRPPNLDPGQRFDPQANPVRDRQSVGVKWTIHDDNDDQLLFSVYHRGDNQTRWLLLKENLSE
jgi:hypothetical protein